MAFSIVDPLTDEPYSRDPRQVAGKAEAYLKSTGIADTASFAPEAEFFIFDKVRFENGMNRSCFEVDSIEAPWNSGVDVEEDGTPNIGFKNRVKKGYFPVPPIDHTQDLRDDMVANLQKVGLILERSHHEVAGAGQQEINYRFNTLQHAGDDLMKYKYVVHETAALAGKAATFMPKPMTCDNGSGMHVHQSIWKDGQNLFAGNGYAGLSELALYYIGGVIKHARALNAITNPTTNSYKRLVPGFEAPVKLAYSSCNRSASLRIPHVLSPKARRVEVRFPDPMANPYLAFSALLMAGLDGIQNKIHPGDAADKNLYDLPPEENAKIPTVCSSLDMALDYLDRDREFLTRGGVFSDDMIDAYIALKMQEVTRYRASVEPCEYDMYYAG